MIIIIAWCLGIFLARSTPCCLCCSAQLSPHYTHFLTSSILCALSHLFHRMVLGRMHPHYLSICRQRTKVQEGSTMGPELHSLLRKGLGSYLLVAWISIWVTKVTQKLKVKFLPSSHSDKVHGWYNYPHLTGKKKKALWGSALGLRGWESSYLVLFKFLIGNKFYLLPNIMEITNKMWTGWTECEKLKTMSIIISLPHTINYY